MRFLSRGLFGMAILGLTLGLLLLAGAELSRSFAAKSDNGRGPKADRERIFGVNVIQLDLKDARPVIDTFGEVISGKTLELRAASAGALVQLSDGFREGGSVQAGGLLFQTDPSTAKAGFELSKTEVADAQAEVADAKAAYALNSDEMAAADKQMMLRERALARQKSLKERGVGTDATIETAALAASTAEQALLAKRQSRAQAKARIDRAEIALSRKRINLSETERKLNDTSVYAEFDGVLANVSAVKGGLVNANEKLGQLIDPQELEVAFRVSSAEYARLLSTDNALPNTEVLILFGLDDTKISSRIARVSAAVGEGQTGREIFAKIGGEQSAFLRLGDFVSVQLVEPTLPNVAIIPASAASSDGVVLVMGDDNRLASAQVEILRKQGNFLIVSADSLDGKMIVAKRAPQLGDGIRVKPRTVGDTVFEENKMVKLSEDEKAKMIAFVQGNDRIPKSVKANMLEKLSASEVPQKMVDRLRSRIDS